MPRDLADQICDILARLVAFNTVSHKSNLEIIGYIAGLLQQHGVTFRMIPDPVLDKAAIWATIGPADRPGFVLSGHTDVVPVDGQSWSSDPFTLIRRGERLHGRGATDMKGFLAVCLALLPQLKAARLSMPIHLAISYDEEVGCTGVRRMLAELARGPIKPLGCFVGEPTSMAVVIGHKGKHGVRATVRGRGCHSALAPHGVNAVEWAAELIVAIRERARQLAATGPRDGLYEVPFTTGLSTMIAGGIATNIVPEQCVVEFEFRCWFHVSGASLHSLSQSENSLQLIKHFRERTLDLQSLLDFISADKGILAVFHEARALMCADKSGEPLRIGLPIERETLEIFENGPHAGRAKKRNGILRILVKIRVEDALIHEVGFALNRKQ